MTAVLGAEEFNSLFVLFNQFKTIILIAEEHIYGLIQYLAFLLLSQNAPSEYHQISNVLLMFTHCPNTFQAPIPILDIFKHSSGYKSPMFF